MMKNLDIMLLLSCLLTLFACGFDDPDDNGSEITTTTQDITLNADACETSIILPLHCESWRLADDAIQEDWFEIDYENAEQSSGTRIPLRVRFNMTGKPRFTTIVLYITTKSGDSSILNVSLRQEPTTYDGRNIHLTLPSKFIAGRDHFVSSSSIRFDEEPLQLIFGDCTVDCEPYDANNVIAKIPDMEPGAYALSVRIGESVYDIGQTGVYIMYGGYPPVQYEPCRFNPQMLPIIGIINLGTEDPHSVALLSDNTTSPVIFCDADGYNFSIPMGRITRLNSRYIAFTYLDAGSEITYNDIDYIASVINNSYTTSIVDILNGNCYALPFDEYIDPETIKWTGYARNGNSRFIAGRKNIVSFEISEERIANAKSLGSHSIGYYPYPVGCGDMISLGNGSLLVNGQLTPVAPYSTKYSMFHFELGDAHSRLTDVPVYDLNALFRVVNYTRFTGTIYLHEMMVEAMDGSSIIAADAWSDNISAGHHYLAICLEPHTYLRPIEKTGSCTALILDKNGVKEERVEHAVHTSLELAMSPQPYYGSYLYVKSGGKICYLPINDYTENAKPLNVSENAFCALGPGRALFAEVTPDGLRVSSFETTSETTKVYDLPDYGYLGWMISF